MKKHRAFIGENYERQPFKFLAILNPGKKQEPDDAQQYNFDPDRI